MYEERAGSHVDLAQLWVYHSALSETRVGPTDGGEVGVQLCDDARWDVIRIHVTKILLIPLAAEDEERLVFRIQNHGMA